MANKPLAPILHQTLKDHHRVPIAVLDNKYEIYLQDNLVRIFEEDELPDIIKARLTMIRAATKTEPSDDPILVARAYEHPLDSNMLEIGWQPCKGLYVVVIPTKDLTYIRKTEYRSGARVHAGFVIANDIPTWRYLEQIVEHKFFLSTVGKFSGHTRE